MTSPDKIKPGEDIAEDERLGTAVQRFVQRGEFNAFERLICSYMVQAITGDPLEGLIFIWRAAMTLDESRCQLLGIDFQEMVDLYTVSQRLASANRTVLLDEIEYNVNFGSLDFGKQVAPWAKAKWYSFGYNPYYHDKVMENMKERSQKAAFLYACNKLTESGYKSMVSDFLMYAISKSQECTRKLSEIVSPATYDDIFKIFTSPRMRVPAGEE